MFQSRTLKNQYVSDKPFNFNTLLGKYYDPQIRSNLWYPSSGHYHVKKVYEWFDGTKPWATQNFAAQATQGDVRLPRAAPTTYQDFPVTMNALNPLVNVGIGAASHPIGGLDIMSVFYERYRITSSKVSFTFVVDALSVASASERSLDETNYWYGELRFGLYLSDSTSRLGAWGLQPDGGTLTDTECENRIREAVESGLLTTVPMTISNDPKYINNSCTISTGWVNILNQFQSIEATDQKDLNKFSGALHNKLNDETHASISAPTTRLYVHPFVYISKPIRKWGTNSISTVEQDIDIHCGYSFEAIAKFGEPRIKAAEGETWGATP